MPRKRQRTLQPIPGDPQDPQGFVKLIHAYLEWMRISHYAATTIHTRRNYLLYFARWCDERGLSRPAEVTPHLLDSYRRALFYQRKRDGRPLSLSSQHTSLICLRAFFKWLAKAHYLLANPAADLALPPQEARLPAAVLSAREVEQIMDVPDLNTPTGLRDRTILEVFYATAIRRAELIHLQLGDLHEARSALFVRQGKGRKDRVVPISRRALAWIDRYLGEARPQLAREPDEGVLFLTVHSTPLSRHRVSEIVRESIRAADIGKHGSCHLFRHTVATLMLDNGADIRAIQQLLGHARLDTTQVYAQVSIRQLKAVHRATHPAYWPNGDPPPDAPEDE